ncbi:MAG: proline--tRNA ligase [Terracidiphilus sp.]|jgi:prolyl-tRNA synthetase
MQRWSKLFIPTLREAPADAEVASHRFLVRAGYIRQLGAGIYNYLFLGQRSINKIIGIVREEMDRIGQEFYLPAIHPKEPWEQSGRWTGMGENMFRLKDRKGAELCLGMTHEEIMTTIARGELRSYKQLPQIWYQIQTKFRDEARPKSGLLRTRQFTMKDSYSFDVDKAGLDRSFDLHDAVYRKIFTRCGLKFVAVEADSGAMGGSQSQEFMVYTDAGEDLIASCPVCGYAANLEKATSRLERVVEMEPTGDGKPELIHTPGMGAIADIAAFLKMSPANDIKCLAYYAVFIGPNGEAMVPVVILLRGDHDLNEAKLASLLSVNILEFMDSDEILYTFVSEARNLAKKPAKGLHEIQVLKTLTSPAGYLGPVGLEPLDIENLRFIQEHGILPKSFSVFKKDETNSGVETLYGTLSPKPSSFRVYYDRPVVILDSSLEGRKNMVCGANKLDYHVRNVTPGRNFSWTLAADIRNVNAGEGCPREGCSGILKKDKAVEVGHIFKLGYKYSESMGARVLDPNGKEVTPIMGSYGIGIERILTAAIEQSNDKNGFWLPASIAPFTVVVTVTNMTDPLLKETGDKLAAELEAASLDVLLDDRDERAGVKFKDADLVGIPYRVNVGKKAAEGKVELVTRSTSTSVDVELSEVVKLVKERVAEDALLGAIDVS